MFLLWLITDQVTVKISTAATSSIFRTVFWVRLHHHAVWVFFFNISCITQLSVGFQNACILAHFSTGHLRLSTNKPKLQLEYYSVDLSVYLQVCVSLVSRRGGGSVECLSVFVCVFVCVPVMCLKGLILLFLVSAPWVDIGHWGTKLSATTSHWKKKEKVGRQKRARIGKWLCLCVCMCVCV